MQFPLIKISKNTGLNDGEDRKLVQQEREGRGAGLDRAITKDGFDSVLKQIDYMGGAARKAHLEGWLNDYTAFRTKQYAAATPTDRNRMNDNFSKIRVALSNADKKPEAKPRATDPTTAKKDVDAGKNNKADKPGPHPGMTALQLKLNEYLTANPTEGASSVKVTGYQNDQGTWGVIKKIWPQWFDGNKPMFKSYSQATDWIKKAMALMKPSAPAAAQEAQKAAPNSRILSEEDRQLVTAWRGFLQADSLNVGEDVVSAYAAGSPRTVGTSLQKYIAEKMKIPVKAGLEEALAHIINGFPAEATAALNRGAAAAKKYKAMRKLV